MLRTQIFLLALLTLAGLASAQAPQRPRNPPKYQPVTYDFMVDSEAYQVIVAELIRDDVPGVKGNMLVRAMQIRYHVPTSDLAEDRIAAVILGVSMDAAEKIDTVKYSGAAWVDQPTVLYVKAEFYAGDRLVAVRDIGDPPDPYRAKAERIYQFARALHEQERKEKERPQKKKAGI